jgi:phosphate/sulfate permease
VGGKLPRLSVSNSTESILYFAVFSAIIGFAISSAVLQIAYRTEKHKAQKIQSPSKIMISC